GLLLAAAALLAARPTQAALPAASDGPALPTAGEASIGDGIFGIEEVITVTVLTLNISNEAPGHLIDALIAHGHGDETLFEVLGYLQAQAGGVISDTFYSDVANAPPGSEVFTARLNNYAGLNRAVEISADGTVHIRGAKGSTYAGMPGYATALGQDEQFTLTYAQDAAHYIYTGSYQKVCGDDICTYNYYAFAIAWREGHTVFLPLVARNP
ncbi:MAG: hypothetical protein ACUVWZ_14470, partial [Anaerolineae bacterium]